jgi:putative sigma-54 modulation protein
MEIDITGRHFQVTAGLKEHILSRIGKLEKYSLKVESAHVVLEVQKFTHIAEIILAGKKLRMKAKQKSLDMYAAFDKSFHNLELQLGRAHDRIKDHTPKKKGKVTART